MTKIECPSATSARCLPRWGASRRYCADRYVSLVLLAAWATSNSTCRSHILPLRVLPLSRLPPLSLWPGHIPAHEAKCLALGNRERSVPTSASRISAARCPTPGIVSSGDVTDLYFH